PLANLDAKLRVQMREELRSLQRRLGITTLYVTHDQEEATAVSDRIAVFNRGQLIQLGTPEVIYTQPQTLFVADFIGRANFLSVKLVDSAKPAAGVLLANGMRLDPRRQVALKSDEADRLHGPDHGIVMIRPEHLALCASHGDLSCRIQRIQLLGGLIRYSVESDGPDQTSQSIQVETTRPLAGITEGSGAWLVIPANDAILYHR
ncbi:MAG: ABC transporter ATP-binding protein, partial [Burkholderiaceae bacterium]